MGVFDSRSGGRDSRIPHKRWVSPIPLCRKVGVSDSVLLSRFDRTARFQTFYEIGGHAEKALGEWCERLIGATLSRIEMAPDGKVDLTSELLFRRLAAWRGFVT